MLLLQKPHPERGFLGVPKVLKSRSLGLALWGLRPLDLIKTLGQRSLCSGVGYMQKKNLKIKIPFQILFYPFRCMFKIMKGYKNFDFTPSGKSLKKTLSCMQYGVLFSINVCLLTYKDLPFTSFQQSLMLSMILATFS